MSDRVQMTIDVVSDVVCPWCYLGKHRLEQALAAMPEVDAEIRWRPFQLDPTIPPGSIDRAEYIRRKFGGPEALDQAHQHLKQAGAAAGIDYEFERITRSPNTIDPHRLIRWAGEAGVEDAMVERLFRLYFTEGADVGDHTVLVQAAKELGMDGDTVARDLATDRDRAQVKADIDSAAHAGITGVPCFIFDRRAAVMGAQSPQILMSGIRQALNARALEPAEEPV
jgi:predicted DsbA family dithiol-disulfide isomerase